MKLFSMMRAAVAVAGFGVLTTGAAAGGLTGPSCIAPLRALFELNNIYEFESAGSTIFALKNDGVVAIDVSDPLNPVELDRYRVWPEQMELVGDVLYCFKETEGLPSTVVMLDVSDPSDITLFAEQPLGVDVDIVPSVGFSLDIEDSIGYFSYWANSPTGLGSGISIVDLSDPQNPVYLASTFSPLDEVFGYLDIEVMGSYLYVYTLAFDSVGSMGIRIYDLSLNMLGYVQVDMSNMVIHDSMLFVCGNTTRVYDLVDPAAPAFLADFPNINESSSINFFGDDAFVGTSDDGLRRYDISDPANPQFLIAYETFGRVTDSITDGSIIYSSNFESGLEIAYINDCEFECVADINSDGAINFLDISAFLTLFIDQDLIVDLNDDGDLNFLDVSFFLNAYPIGC